MRSDGLPFEHRHSLEYKPRHPNQACQPLTSGFFGWRQRIVPRKYALFVAAHFNGAANGKMFGMKFDIALSAVGAGAEEQVKLRHQHE